MSEYDGPTCVLCGVKACTAEPDSKTPLPGGGEVWKWAGQGWKRHVPVYGTWAHVEEHTVTFGTDGKVVGNNTKDYGNAFQEPWRRR